MPCQNTLWVWTNEEAAERQRAAKRVVGINWRLAHASFAWPGVRSHEWKLERMRRLRRLGLTFREIAIVMTHDFPSQPITDEQVRYLLTKP